MSETNACPLCDLPNTTGQSASNMDAHWFDCLRCGRFAISGTLGAMLQFRDHGVERYVLSALSRELKETDGKPPMFDSSNIESLTKSYPVPNIDDIAAKARKLLERLRGKTHFFGEMIEVDYTNDYPLAYAMNADELVALVQLLGKKGLINPVSETNRDVTLQISADGWDVLSQRNGNWQSSQGFIAISFTKESGEVITAIESSIRDCGFEPMCIRDKHYSEKIFDKALGEIRRSRFVVVDLSEDSDSVYFEAGFAHGLDIKSIYLFRKDSVESPSRLDFYVRHYKCYQYNNVSELKAILTDAIKARFK